MKHRTFIGRNPFGMLSEWESEMRSLNTPADIRGYCTGHYIGLKLHVLMVFYEADDEDQPSQPQRPANE